MQKETLGPGLADEDREHLESSEYGRSFLKEWDKPAQRRRIMAEASTELLRIGMALGDQRLLVIAEQYARNVPPSPGGYWAELWGWEDCVRNLEADRGRMHPVARAKLEQLESPKCKPIEYHEERNVRWAMKREKYRRVSGPEEAEKRSMEEVPFAELRDDSQRKACLRVIVKRRDKAADAPLGEKMAREVLAKFYRLGGTSRELLSLRFAVEEGAENEIRQSRKDLWTLLRGVRELTAKADGLGAPEDVRVGLRIWQARVRDAAYFPDAFFPPSHEVLEELSVEAKGDHLVRRPVNRRSLPKFRDARRNLESRLLNGMRLSPKEISILETVWLLPVTGGTEETMVPLSAESSANCTRQNRPPFPIRHRWTTGNPRRRTQSQSGRSSTKLSRR